LKDKFRAGRGANVFLDEFRLYPAWERDASDDAAALVTDAVLQMLGGVR
jgi:hypothetical protein